jgi:hypothetical protein
MGYTGFTISKFHFNCLFTFKEQNNKLDHRLEFYDIGDNYIYILKNPNERKYSCIDIFMMPDISRITYHIRKND